MALGPTIPYAASMLPWLKRTSIELVVGALVGFVIWSFVGKRLTSMLFGSLGGSFSCSADVELGLDKFLAMQLYSALGGAALAVLAMFLFRRRRARRDPA
ncbi:MAG TPA: hypothetical protein VHM70_14905 [Polyangiaceae bacterium]|jgi:Mg/Co/Ni transporter MgtE|nr:hypothetical protein [Polyangiaceae bacterium]